MKKKLLCLSFVILFGFAPKNCLAKYSGGNGSESNPYRISDAYDMNDIGLHQEDWASQTTSTLPSSPEHSLISLETTATLLLVFLMATIRRY